MHLRIAIVSDEATDHRFELHDVLGELSRVRDDVGIEKRRGCFSKVGVGLE
jgi:hypothetical protein